MDVFGTVWSNHVERLQESWSAIVEPDDTVIIAGDIDWAMHLADAFETLDLIESLPGTKILIRGNHDYWWSSKTTGKVRARLPTNMLALHNDAISVDGFNVCGAKGSPVPGGMDWTEQNAKLLNREVQRLRMSLDNRDPALPTIVALHYPPFYPANPDSPFRLLVQQAHASAVVYGHLHGTAAASGPSGVYAGTEYRLVAADAVDFSPVRLGANGTLLPAGA